MVKRAQTHNGLKHNDYQRYRRYCTKRLRRMRKASKLQYGRGKFHVKEWNEATSDDPTLLQIYLFNAERCWAFAQNLKQEAAQDEEINNRRKFCIRKKFKKAYQWAEKLLKTC